jgi:hypothetical protein
LCLRDYRLLGGVGPERHLLAFFWKIFARDILNNEHEIRRETTSLLRVHRDALYLFPHKIHHTKWWSSIPHVG